MGGRTDGSSDAQRHVSEPVQELLDYLAYEEKHWNGVNADRYWQTARIRAFVQSIWSCREITGPPDDATVMRELDIGGDEYCVSDPALLPRPQGRI